MWDSVYRGQHARIQEPQTEIHQGEQARIQESETESVSGILKVLSGFTADQLHLMLLTDGMEGLDIEDVDDSLAAGKSRKKQLHLYQKNHPGETFIPAFSLGYAYDSADVSGRLFPLDLPDIAYDLPPPIHPPQLLL
ncbi:hypothetical protein TREMEDRAFT_56503 [Tremella mesenterica DSM 1558]|uniref:uncharacterized protein n=1 Tax=Tremella mesenterica (strain ATCC 24925 / CBS 8224 / DSM 1558 / NBRC 9311 / NRRL Y-6157 / RJB 2259-6 / UBC 559-6) TaxID=578456 RepID=UPI0003F49D67|nr:uncharacterized protein TREMEDRAFT_56503 [Tremella mesenterica DSM 1558]EIW71663.1 hypothetical protein TREMEDRAFT_56503 [Tremella mesenterica DSM 1558]